MGAWVDRVPVEQVIPPVGLTARCARRATPWYGSPCGTARATAPMAVERGV